MDISFPCIPAPRRATRRHNRKKTYHSMIQSIQNHQWQTIQAQHIRYVPKMHSTRRWPSHPSGYTCRYLWATRQQSITSGQSFSGRDLLAHSTQGRRRHRQKMHRLPEIRNKAALSCLGRVTPGVNDIPFFGSAWGVKEAVDLFTRREFMGGQRAETWK